MGLTYAGDQYQGYQSQANGRGVQNVVENALAKIDASASRITAAGRTDSGVHATAQVVSFETPLQRTTTAWLRGLNSHLPASVRVTWVREVRPGFNARFAATGRRYIYLFLEGEAGPLVLGRATATAVLNDAAMHRAAQCLVGEHDFSSFRASTCQSPTAQRRVDHVRVGRIGPWITIDVAANAFLLRMMRNIAGALRSVGLGEWSEDAIQTLLFARDRTRLGRTAPPDGLYLVEVRYPSELLLHDSDRDLGFPAGVLPPFLAHSGTLDRL